MTRKEEVFLALKDLTREISLKPTSKLQGFDAQFLSDYTGLDRANVSRELNKLLREGRLVKVNGKPVFYFEKEELASLLDVTIPEGPVILDSLSLLTEEPLKDIHDPLQSMETLIGAEGSLRMPIQKAQASVVYPSGGLNILLTGSTGVGKSTFSELIYLYAKEQNCLPEDAKFIVFNCSEYADNPQLLLSHLFGHVKGAFTGADSEKRGLVEEAEGGILLLDEIHRLGPEGQEMLFLLIDKGSYRKLGESKAMREANVIIIAATTEDPNSYLLKTFLRRFPMVIQLPSLADRPVEERFSLIRDFFLQESKKIQCPIHVEREVIQTLLFYNCPGNIGQLKADIQLLCARAFLYYMKGDESEIYIDQTLLPQHITETSLKNNQCIFEEGAVLVFDFDRKESSYDQNHSNQVNHRQYDRLYTKFRRLLNSDKGFFKIQYEIRNALDEYLADVFQLNNKKLNTISLEKVSEVVSPVILGAVTEAFSACEEEININIETIIGLSLQIEGSQRHNDYGTGGSSRNILPGNLDGIDVKLMKCSYKINDYLQQNSNLFLTGEAAFIYMLISEVTELEQLEPADNHVFGKDLIGKTGEAYTLPAEEDEILNLLRESIVFIDPIKTYKGALVCFEHISEAIPEKRRKSMEVRFLLHVACMLERLIQKMPLAYPGLEELKSERPAEFNQMKSALKSLEYLFCIDIPDAEIGFLVDLAYTL